ncbi:oxidoreductase [Paenibacillus crassostreae]|uniref:Oxidoreductase n=2 Tax=Paenibacillus crassostreae TaxID=1763538 RepID=A0A167GPT2_9BACL|nr:oxidoreductase [Paenibacillus crassostreae]OAB77785.1 oxidoreductase [Paenibacillus crassostreae]
MMLKDKVIVITGASSGIGALAAKFLSDQGAIPVLTARSLDKLKSVGAQLTGVHDLIMMDVTKQEQVQQVMKQIIDRYGRIDILLNNAGFGKFDSILEMPVDEFSDMMDVNYMGTVRCTKAVLPFMLERGEGQIVNVASMAAKIGTARSTSYTATKHAVYGFSNSLRQELRGTGITVSTVNPGPIDTPFFELADPSGKYLSNINWFIMKPEYVAHKMIRLMKHKQEEINLPWLAAAGMRLYQLFPRLADKLTHKMLNKK